QHEKSRAVLSTPERPVRSKVFAIFLTMLSKRLWRMASRTPSTLRELAWSGALMLLIVKTPSRWRLGVDTNGEAAISRPLDGGTGIHYDCGEVCFNQQRPE